MSSQQTCQQWEVLTESNLNVNVQQACSSETNKASTSKEKSQSAILETKSRAIPKAKASTIQKGNIPKAKTSANGSTKLKASKSKPAEDDGPPTKKRCQPKTVEAKLEKMGVNSKRVSSCIKSAMSKGHILLTGNKSDLEQVIIEGRYDGHTFKVYLKDVLYQPDYAGSDYEDGLEEATVLCTCCEEEDDDDDQGRCYITRICEGHPEFDSGKSHNHCTECKGFGKCIGDYREAHCRKCNKHWFAGSSGFPCTNCKKTKSKGKFGQNFAWW